MVEITENAQARMYAAGFYEGRAALYEVDPSSGVCHAVSRFSTRAPWALGFVPSSSPSQPGRLMGDESGSLMLLNPTKGTRITFAPLQSSDQEGCDIVVAPDGATYVSVLADWTNPDAQNVLQQVDPLTGQVIRDYPLAAGEVLEGLAYAGDTLYGFGAGGGVFAMSVGDGTVTSSRLAVQGGPAHFTGAASVVRAGDVPR